MKPRIGVWRALAAALFTAAVLVLKASALTLTTVPIAFPGVTLSGADQTANTSNATWRADGEDNPAPWHVNVSSTDFGIDEVQRAYNDATAGTFTLTFSGQTTADIAYNASAATVESALEALSTITDVTVTGVGTSGDPWVVIFVNPGKQNVAEMTADDTNLTGGTSTILTTTEGRTIGVSNFEIRLLDANIVVVSGAPNPKPTSTQTIFAPLSGTDLKIVSATAAAGRNAWDLTPDLRLAIESASYSGNYSATVTIAIAVGP